MAAGLREVKAEVYESEYLRRVVLPEQGANKDSARIAIEHYVLRDLFVLKLLA
jgi:hypothetical protein